MPNNLARKAGSSLKNRHSSKVDWPYKDSYVPEAKYLPKSMSLITNKPSPIEKHFKIK